MTKIIRVAAAAIVNEQGQVLIARRPDDAHQGGLWEFPGGKLEPYETGRQALRRELLEELGIEPLAARPLIRVHFSYPDKRVLLDVWRVERYRGEPYGREGQPIRWVALEQLRDYRFPAANRPIIQALQLPSHYLITGESSAEDFQQRLEQALRQGIRLVQLRAHELSTGDYLRRAEEALGLCRRFGARLILNTDPALLEQVDADGIHLTRWRLMACRERPIPPQRLLSVACHTLDELEQANRLAADLATLSPLQLTPSHPEATPLGWQRLQDWSERAQMPLYALGGLQHGDLAKVQALGGQGIAGIRAFWGN